MNNEEVINDIVSKQQKCVELVKQIQAQKQTIENYKGFLNNPEIDKLESALSEVLKRFEDTTEFSLPKEVIHTMQVQQEESSKIITVFTELAAAQDKIIQEHYQLADLQTDMINSLLALINNR